MNLCRIVESVGEGVSEVEEGDTVVPIFNGECGECCYCKCEKSNMCERYGVNPMKKVMEGDGRSRFSTVDGKPIFHFLNTSTFSEYTVVDSACVVKFRHSDHTLTTKNLTLLSCGVSTGQSNPHTFYLLTNTCVFSIILYFIYLFMFSFGVK